MFTQKAHHPGVMLPLGPRVMTTIPADFVHPPLPQLSLGDHTDRHKGRAAPPMSDRAFGIDGDGNDALRDKRCTRHTPEYTPRGMLRTRAWGWGEVDAVTAACSGPR